MTSPDPASTATPSPSATTPGQMAEANVSGGAMWLTAAFLYHGIGSFFIFMVAARVLTIAEFGVFSTIMALVLAIEMMANQGLPKGLARSLPLLMEHRPAAVLGWVRWMLFVSFLFTALLTGVLFLASPFIAVALGNAAYTPLLQLASLDIIAFVGFIVWWSAFNGLHLYRIQAFVLASYSTGKTLLIIWYLLTEGTVVGGIQGYVIGSLFGSISAGLFYALIVPGHVRRRLESFDSSEVMSDQNLALLFVGKDSQAAAQPSTNPTKLWKFNRVVIQFAVPVGLVSLVLSLLLNVDLMLAKAFLPDTEAGYYAGASQVTRMIYFVFMAFSEALFPAVAQAVARNDIELSQRQVRRGLSLLLVLLIPVAGLGMGLTAPTLAVILGPPFAQGADVLLLLIIVAALLTLINVLGSVLSAQGFPAHFLLLVVLALAATFLGGYTVLSAMNTSLEPLVSAQVLAVTVVVILYVTNYLLITLLRRKVPSFGWPFRASIVGFIGFAVLFSLPPFLAPSNWWLLAYGGAWFGAYAAIAYLFAGKYAGIR